MWKVFIIIVPIAVAVGAVTGEWWGSLAAGVILTTAILVLRAGVVVVPERKVAVIFNRLGFYTGLRDTGLGFVLPFWERVGFYLDSGPKPAQITVRDMHTSDQVPVTISLSLFYRLNPWEMQPELRPQLIDLLELSAMGMLQRQVEHLLRRLVGQQEIGDLLQSGARAHLEDCLANQLPRHVSRLGIVIQGLVMLGDITLPERVQAELNLAHQARTHARARAEALNALRETLSTQPERAWEKAIEVEAIDALARNGVPVLFPFSTGWEVGAFRSRADGKG